MVEPHVGYTPHPYVGGRDTVLRVLADWRAGNARVPRTVVLTGTPGAGCTRLITGFLMLCGGEFRERMPLAEMDPSIIPPAELPSPLVPRPDRLSVEEVAWALARRLAPAALSSDRPPEMADVTAALATYSDPVTIVVPDIDRAELLGVQGPVRLVREVLRPLAATESVRLLLDLPRPLLGELMRELSADDVLVIDVDEPRWWDADGLVRQVEDALTPRFGAPELPFTTDAAAREALAEAIGYKAGNNVLVMDLTVRGLYAVAEDFGPADGERLPRTVGQVLEWHAERIGADAEALRTALAPLALSSSPDGMPEPLWRRLVAAVDDQGTGASSVLETSAVEPFVSRTPRRGGDARVALVHHVLGAEIRSGLRDVRAVQSRIAMALLEEVPEQNWAKADAYVTDHIAEHTLEAGLLPQLLTDPGLFIHADPVRMLAALSAVPEDALAPPARAYLRILPLLARIEDRPPLRAALLETSFVQHGLGDYAAGVRRLGMDLPWQTLWTLPVPGVRGVSAGTLLPPEEPDGPPGLPTPAAVLVVSANTPGAVPLTEESGGDDGQETDDVIDDGHDGAGSEAGLLTRDLNRSVPLDVTDLDRLVLPSEETRSAAPLAISPGTHAVQVWDRSDELELATFHSDQPLVDVDISPEGVLLVSTETTVTALRIRRSLGPIL